MDATVPGAPDEQAPAATPALDLGARLRAERLRQGMSLREMARRVGVSASALSQIETGKAQPSVSKLFDIVNLLDTSLDGLLAGASGRAPTRPRRATAARSTPATATRPRASSRSSGRGSTRPWSWSRGSTGGG
jgi:transcriptional regulator with XRE-family HTH domain